MAAAKDALDIEAVKLLKTDPDKYYETRRVPFGFALSEKTKEAVKDIGR